MNIFLIVNSSVNNFKNLDNFLNQDFKDWKVIVITNCNYKNDKAKIINYVFKYWNEAFTYFYTNNKEAIEYIAFLDDDDYINVNNRLNEFNKVKDFDYWHDTPVYKNTNYNYNSISHNNSCIMCKFNMININLIKITYSLSDFLLYVSFINSKIHIGRKNTIINLHSFNNYKDFFEYYFNRINLRFTDLSNIISRINLYNLNNKQIKILEKEYIKYRCMIGYPPKVKLSYLLDKNILFAYLNRNKTLDFFARNEYNNMYKVKQ